MARYVPKVEGGKPIEEYPALVKGREALKERRMSGALLPREEKFAQLMADVTMSQTQAAIAVGYSKKNAKTQASKMMRRPRIANRITELRSQAGQRNEVTIDEIITNLRESYGEAFDKGQFSAAIRAAELLGKYLGMFSDKLSVTHTGSLKGVETERLKKIAGLGRS